MKRRAPISKKRASNLRLEKAKQLFKEERTELEETLKLVLEDIGGFEILSWEDNPGIRLKVAVD